MISPASERSELAGAEERRSSASGGGSVDGGAGHCPEAPGGCSAARLSGCSAAGRMRPAGRIFPFQTIRSVWLTAEQAA